MTCSPPLKDRLKRYGSTAAGDEGLDEQHRRTVVRLFFWMYGLLIFEGVLRKWVLPGFSQQLFFVRDPFLIAIYSLILHNRKSFPSSIFLFSGLVLAGASLLVLLGQLVFVGTVQPYLAVYGWRNYFAYLPLAFVIGSYLRMGDLNTLVRRTLIFAIPMSLIVIAQVSSSMTSPINAGFGEDPTESWVNTSSLLEGGIVRPSGTFTSNLGLTAFTTSAVAFSMAMWLLPETRKTISRGLLLVCTAATMVCLALSGSRGAVLWSGVIVVLGIAGLIVTRPATGFRSIGIAGVIVACGVITMPVLFPETTHAFVTRWNGANEAESQAYGGRVGVFSRFLNDFGGFAVLIHSTPMFGYGLGAAGNAAWRLGARETIIPFANEEELGAAESDWGRNILELGPVFGLILITYRVAFTIAILSKALAGTRISGDPINWLLFTFVGNLLMYGQMTANGTLNGYGWIFTGLCLAAGPTTISASRQAGQALNAGYQSK